MMAMRNIDTPSDSPSALLSGARSHFSGLTTIAEYPTIRSYLEE